MLGTGVGGLAMGWLAERVGVRLTVKMGATMVCAGLCSVVGRGGVAALRGARAAGRVSWQRRNPTPLYVYITRWFERRRGTALALIASGQYVAGAAWPSLFERAIAALWLAADHDGLRRARGTADRAARCPRAEAGAGTSRHQGRLGLGWTTRQSALPSTQLRVSRCSQSLRSCAAYRWPCPRPI